MRASHTPAELSETERADGFSLTADFCRSQLCTVCTVMHSLELTNDLQIVSSFVTTPLKM